MTTSNGSRALITDFDGTLVHLAVDWTALRRELGVAAIADAVRRGDAQSLSRIAVAERDGAVRGQPVPEGIDYVLRFPAFAVLTQNSETAVHAFLDQNSQLRRRCRVVLGRETHQQRKRDAPVFAELIERCMKQLEAVDVTEVTYLGDEAYELELASGIGLRAVDVASLSR
ncbi:MAG: hypothetical protein JOY68_05340 [Candidatus Dormibacteraeota bacterium]|nr:hypothetical protein [Candidatus Dormibacteraeota bacterium]